MPHVTSVCLQHWHCSPLTLRPSHLWPSCPSQCCSPYLLPHCCVHVPCACIGVSLLSFSSHLRWLLSLMWPFCISSLLVTRAWLLSFASATAAVAVSRVVIFPQHFPSLPRCARFCSPHHFSSFHVSAELLTIRSSRRLRRAAFQIRLMAPTTTMWQHDSNVGHSKK